MRKFNAIRNAVNFGKGKKMSNEIQVNDKVKWLHGHQVLNQQCFGHVVSTHVKVMGNPCFQIIECGSNRQVMVNKDKVSLV